MRPAGNPAGRIADFCEARTAEDHYEHGTTFPYPVRLRPFQRPIPVGDLYRRVFDLGAWAFPDNHDGALPSVPTSNLSHRRPRADDPLVAGEYDLSIGAVVTSAAILAISLQSNHGWSMWPAIAVTLLASVACGLVNGFIIVRLKVSSFIATLGMGTLVTAC